MVTRNVKAKRYVNVLGKMDASSQQLREGEREREMKYNSVLANMQLTLMNLYQKLNI